MSVQTLASPMAPTGCPDWCDGTHPNIEDASEQGTYHCVEVGRIDSGVLALIVSVAHWVSVENPNTIPAVTLSWEGIGDEAGYVHLLEGIELDPTDAEALAPLLVQALTILRNGRRA